LTSRPANSLDPALTVLRCGARALDLTRVIIMGVLNITPDSFFDGGRHRDLDAALRRAAAMADEGAEIIDIGGESTRPGAAPVSEAEELARVVPVIEAVHDRVDAVISVDTSKPAVMRAAIAAGAGFINDVYALRQPGALAAATAAGVPVCLMHMQGEPRSMQAAPEYGNVVASVVEFLRERVATAREAGIPHDQLVIDPGFGFGKTLSHNVDLLRNLPEFLQLGLPVLVGLSRKSLIGGLIGAPVQERAAASVALALIAAQNGAHIVRVHDVAMTRDAIRTWEAVRS